MKIAETAWKRIGDISLAQWIWQLLPTTVGALSTSWLAYMEDQPPWVLAIAFLAAFALLTLGIAGVRLSKVATVKEAGFEELRAKVRDRELAEMMGKEDAKRAYRSKLGMASLGLESSGLMTDAFGKYAEIEEAKHRGRLKRLENGDEE